MNAWKTTEDATPRGHVLTWLAIARVVTACRGGQMMGQQAAAKVRIDRQLLPCCTRVECDILIGREIPCLYNLYL